MLAAIVFGHLRSFKQPPLRPPLRKKGGCPGRRPCHWDYVRSASAEEYPTRGSRICGLIPQLWEHNVWACQGGYNEACLLAAS